MEDSPIRNKINIIIEDHGEWLEVDVSTPSHPNAVMKIDTIDFNYLKSRYKGRMHAYKAIHQTYPYVNIKVKSIANRLHRLLLPESKVVDHINHNGLDNRRSNIRACTQMENNKNIGMRKDNTSGYTGVGSYKGRWTVDINCNKKNHRIGTFKTKQEAINARKEAEVIFWGENSPALLLKPYENKQGEIDAI